MKKRILVVLLAIVMLASTACSTAIKSTKEQSRIVGNVGSFDVSYERLRYTVLSCRAEIEYKYGEDAFDTDFEKYEDMLEDMVEERLAIDAATCELFKENKIKTTNRDIKKKVESYASALMDTYDSEEDYVSYLDSCFMTDTVFRFNKALEYCLEELYDKLSKEWDRESYDAVMEQKGFYRAMNIFIRNDKGESVAQNRADAERIREEIAGGKPLESYIGTKYNQDTGLCDYYFTKGYMEEEYEEAVFELEIGEISTVVETEEGFYIIQRMPLDEGKMALQLDYLKMVYSEAKMYSMIEEKADDMELELNSYGQTLEFVHIK